jgi:hypothetical protein
MVFHSHREEMWRVTNDQKIEEEATNFPTSTPHLGPSTRDMLGYHETVKFAC